jgi:hypothetical protein
VAYRSRRRLADGAAHDQRHLAAGALESALAATIAAAPLASTRSPPGHQDRGDTATNQRWSFRAHEAPASGSVLDDEESPTPRASARSSSRAQACQEATTTRNPDRRGGVSRGASRTRTFGR